MIKFKVVVTDQIGDSYEIEKKVLNELGVNLFSYNCITINDVIEVCKDADGILCNLAPMPEEVLSQLTKCKIISRYGIGYDNVNVEYCTQKDIWVANVPDYCIHEVSEHAISLLMTCARNIVNKNTHIRNGIWDQKRIDSVSRIYGKTIALLGFGNIPRAMLKILIAFGLRVLVYDPFVDEHTIKKEGALKVNWENAFKEADFISIHLPYTKQTEKIVNESALRLMKRTAILINTSRGGVIDEIALISALQNHEIGYAGLDVFSKEPIPENSPLLKLENCVLTDHTAWYSVEAINELKTKCAENIKAVLMGNQPQYAANHIRLK